MEQGSALLGYAHPGCTQTWTCTNQHDAEANASGRCVRVCVAHKSVDGVRRTLKLNIQDQSSVGVQYSIQQNHIVRLSSMAPL